MASRSRKFWRFSEQYTLFHQIIPQDLQRKTQGDGRHGRQQQHGQQLQTQPAVGAYL